MLTSRVYSCFPKYRNPSEDEKDLSEDMAKVSSYTEPRSVTGINQFI